MRTLKILLSLVMAGWVFVSSFAQRPNILFIEVDDLQYEYLSFNGAKYPPTPHVDKLAKEGVYFRNAVAQGMMCGPSRNSLMTGLYPHNLGFYYNGQMKSLPQGVWTFPKALQRAGYFTAWIGKCHIRPYIAEGKNKTEAMAEEMGFDLVHQTLGRAVLCKQLKKGKKLNRDWYVSFLREKDLVNTFVNECGKTSTLPEDVYLDGFFTGSARAFLDNYHEKKPFFLWLNYSLPHGPFDVPEKYHTFDPQEMPGGTRVKNYTPPPELVKKTKPARSEVEIRDHQAGLCANISLMDKYVGEVLETLKERGLLENTVIVFFSDQGVMIGDHWRFHKGTLYRQITNPALIVSWPGHIKQGIVIDDPVELTDLVHTTLELAGANKEDLKERPYSVSLLPALYKGRSTGRKTGFAEIEGYAMATDGRYRLVRGKDALFLFDDEKDPKNLVNIADQHPEVVKKLSAALDKWYEETGKPLPPKSY